MHTHTHTHTRIHTRAHTESTWIRTCAPLALLIEVCTRYPTKQGTKSESEHPTREGHKEKVYTHTVESTKPESFPIVIQLSHSLTAQLT